MIFNIIPRCRVKAIDFRQFFIVRLGIFICHDSNLQITIASESSEVIVQLNERIVHLRLRSHFYLDTSISVFLPPIIQQAFFNRSHHRMILHKDENFL